MTNCKYFLAFAAAAASASVSTVSAFVPPTAGSLVTTTAASNKIITRSASTELKMMESIAADIITSTSSSSVDLSTVASIVASTASDSSSVLLSETEAWVQPLANVLGPFLNLFSFAMLCRVVISWYPTTNVNEFPFLLAVWPTEPLLRLIRGAVPPAFGVDITPIVWLGFFTFLNEILLGQQGLLTMKIKYGI